MTQIISLLPKRGFLVDSFVLSISNPSLPNKGILVADNPLLWQVPQLWLAKKIDSVLNIFIAKKLTTRFANITIKMKGYNKNAADGIVQLKYNTGKKDSKDVIAKLAVSAGSDITSYNFSTSVFSTDNALLLLSSTDFEALIIEETKIEIFDSLVIIK